ncbi:Sulfotransferase domain protein [Roseovarius aestuarii]|uniref:Sulfotransferase domain protein n=3 Tax=Roseovarius aestuarii TaxID=475083 RepID=A0A1X7BLV8_9RHOB|nr:Sulfotransferase domain protein [Roseovarius aestuarii]
MMTNLQRIIWLASFPKSGNTWVRVLLANYFMPRTKAPDINSLSKFTTGDIRKDFFDRALGHPYSASSIEEWLEVRQKALRLIAASKPNHHFVKTHCQTTRIHDMDVIPPEVTAAAVYVMRNPFDLAPSFARHQSADIDTTIERMCSTRNIMATDTGMYEPLGRWDDHVNTWTQAPGLPLYVIRYEDMLANPGKTVSAMLEKFMKVKVDRPKLAYAVKQASFKSLQKQEKEIGFSEKPATMKSFFTKGKAGAWRDDLTPAQVGRLRSEFEDTLKKWYPEMLEETGSFASTA